MTRVFKRVMTSRKRDNFNTNLFILYSWMSGAAHIGRLPGCSIAGSRVSSKSESAIMKQKSMRAARYLSILFSACGLHTSFAAIDCEGTTDIYDIQGATHISPFNEQHVKVCGVVTAVAFNGFYLQDPIGDGDPATSDALFVLKPGETPKVGTKLRLTGTITEYIPGGAATGNLSITNLVKPRILASALGQKLPDPVVIGRGGRVPPDRIVISEPETVPPINLQNTIPAQANAFDPTIDGIDFYESLEGMLVRVVSPVAVSATRQFDTYSAELFVLANRGKDVYPKGVRTQRGGINLVPHLENMGDHNPERIQIQFNATLFSSTNYPSIKVGDQLEDIVGVVGYSFGNFEVNALHEIEFKPSLQKSERVKQTLPSQLTVASYNVLNLSAVPADDAQRQKIAQQIQHKLRAPDIVALQEVQDNNGDSGECLPSDPSPCSNLLDASETLQKLVEAIEAVGGPAYHYITVDPLVETRDDNRDNPDIFGGVPLGNIRNAFLYNPKRVTLKEYTGLTREVLADRGVTACKAFDSSRDPLEAVFEFRGQTLVLINNHFTSRFGSTPIFGGPQPLIQAGESAREAQALAMNQVTHWHRQHKHTKIVVLGDLNTFEFTNDLTEILPGSGKQTILYNLISKNHDDNRYSFNFEGNSQTLDHIFVTRPLLQGAKFDFVHVNVDYPRRFSDVVASDHDPLWAAFYFVKKEEVLGKLIDLFKSAIGKELQDHQ